MPAEPVIATAEILEDNLINLAIFENVFREFFTCILFLEPGDGLFSFIDIDAPFINA